ncbi:TetR/AcrR family transcriptional regulator [Streptomyces sp. NPDC020801]|uniref:TetR/AcrR family transcriptional regulator n=1 Tax=unclassified Streptomyces TaxID=2593676 RepID=UPI0037A854F4
MEEERLKLILDAAYTCFTRHGVRRTTMDDIARQAGMSRPGVYQYVRNKEDAFRRLAARLLDDALAEARAAIGTRGDLGARLTAALEAKLGLAMGLWRDSPAHAAELLGADTRLSAEQVEAYNTAMRDLISTAVAADHPDADAVEVAELLLAFTRGLEADLSDAEAPVRRLRHGVALLITGLGRTDNGGDNSKDNSRASRTDNRTHTPGREPS